MTDNLNKHVSSTQSQPSPAVELSTDHSQHIHTLAKLAGLDRALAQFPQDVDIAAMTALKIRASFQAVDDSTVEPWPTMRVK